MPLEALALGLGAFSSILGAAGSYISGEAKSKFAKIQARAYRDTARRIHYRTQIASRRQEDVYRKTIGEQISKIAASGGNLSDPTSQMIMSETASESYLDKLLIQLEGIEAESQALMGGSMAAYGSKMYNSQAKYEAMGSLMSGAGRLISGGADLGLWG